MEKKEGLPNVYTVYIEDGKVKKCLKNGNKALGRLKIGIKILKDTFLPVGFPETVREEYLSYQLWDSLQALSSYLRGVLTARAMLEGAGVGNAKASALAVALSWIIKDGIGIISSLLFAYTTSSAFELYPKEWRYIADLLCNVGLTAQMLVHSFPEYYFACTVVSSVSFACLGIAAGATKTRISVHLAKKGHLADVAAKESTQETAVTLLGMVLGYYISARYCHDNKPHKIWLLFVACTAAHIYCNRRLVNVLVFDTLNPQRAWLLAQSLWEPSKVVERKNQNHKLLTPLQISKKEDLFYRPLWLVLYGPRMAAPLSDLIRGIMSAFPRDEDAKIAQYCWTSLTAHDAWCCKGLVIGLDAESRVLLCVTDPEQVDGPIAYVLGCQLSNFLDNSVRREPAKPSSIMFTSRFATLFKNEVSDKMIESRLRQKYKVLAHLARMSVTESDKETDWLRMGPNMASAVKVGWDISKGSGAIGGEGWSINISGVSFTTDNSAESDKDK
jgi:hypothetical protein